MDAPVPRQPPGPLDGSPPPPPAAPDPYQPLFELAGVGLAQIDPVSYRFLRVNRRLCQMTGFAESELLAVTPIDITHPDDWTADRPAFESLLRGDFTEHVVEKRYLRKDGSIAWVMVTLNPVRDPATGRLLHLVSVVRDIDKRKRAEANLERRNRALTFLSDAATRLLMNDRPDGVIPDIVARLAALLDLEYHATHSFDPTERRLHMICHSPNLEPVRDRVRTLELGQFASGTVALHRRPLVLEHADSSTDPAAAMVRAVGATAWISHPLIAGGRLVGTLALGTRRRPTFDPSDLELVRTTCDQIAMALERRRLTLETESRAQDLSRANAAKDQFLAALSHELRTPLTPVLLAASSMESDPSLPRATRDELTTIRQNVELEARLIDDLLDLTRIAHGKLPLDLQPVDVHALIHQTIRGLSPDAAAKRIIVTADLAAPDCHCHADPARLQQILLNLLKNAIKFTPEGGLVTIRTRPPENNGDAAHFTQPSASTAVARMDARLIIEVSDTGIGIPPEMLPKIFDAFEQGTPSITRRFGGLGLGLAISRALAAAHHGSLTAFSKGKNQGSTFTLTLPAAPAIQHATSHTPQAPAAAPATAQKPQPRLQILLVEDHPSTASTLARLLRKLGHSVTVATGVRNALQSAAAQPPDLLISDIGLPDGTGLELVRNLRSSHPTLTAIALSGYGTDADIQRSLAAGFSQHLTKPINIDQLKSLTTRP